MDIQEIRKSIEIFKPNQLIEVRTFGKPTMSGYFRDADTLVKSVSKIPNETLYFVMNEINEACYAKEQRDKMITNPKSTTSDKEIIKRHWILIDADPKRVSNVSASDDEKEKAQEVIERIYDFLDERGFEKPVFADSGNGYHLLYRVELLNEPFDNDVVKNFLLALDMLFTDEYVSIDTTVFNASRITKLYGTVAKKGANTPDRPHRQSRILHAPNEVKKTRLALIQQISDMLPKAEEIQAAQSSYGYKSGFNLRDFIAKHGIRVKQELPFDVGTKFILDHCIFDESHRGKDAALFLLSNGAISYRCFHASCSCYKWQDVRMKYEADAYKPVDAKPKPNYKNADYKPQTVNMNNGNAQKNSESPAKDAPVFYTTAQIRQKKGFVTCLSGLRGSGKSSLISQFTLEAVQQGYKVALFSGELTDENTLKWLTLQAAGKDYVYPTQYENYWRVDDREAESISKWLNEKVYIYNNDYGNKFDFLLDRLNKCVTENKVDLIILDNLMSINIGMLDKDKYIQQGLFVEMLEVFAKANNVHVIFAAHPRKSDGFLRLDDVSGSGDITNRVDNAFIMHRVNHDFRKATKAEYRWSDDHELYQCQNVIEICKDRDGGNQDEFIPLYFEKSCKRLKNTEHENKNYSWKKPYSPYGDNNGLVEVTSSDELPAV